MAIEDEIVNISDLDIGTEILKTDKLLVETTNGTKLLNFRDFVIGLDNISFYHLISGRGDNTGNKQFFSVGGFNILRSDTDTDHKPTYSDLQGTIDLSVRNYNAYTTLQDISGNVARNRSDIQNILARIGQITALLETEQKVTLKAGAKLRLYKVKSWASAGDSNQRNDHEWYDGIPADLEVRSDGTDTDIVTIPPRLLDTTSSTVDSVNFKVSVTGNDITIPASGNLAFNRTTIDPAIGTIVQNPFKMTYPSATQFLTSTISFDVYIEIIYANAGTSADSIPITVYINGTEVRKGYRTNRIGTTYIYDFSLVEEVSNDDVVLIKFGSTGKTGVNAPKIGKGSSFSGVRMF